MQCDSKTQMPVSPARRARCPLLAVKHQDSAIAKHKCECPPRERGQALLDTPETRPVSHTTGTQAIVLLYIPKYYYQLIASIEVLCSAIAKHKCLCPPREGRMGRERDPIASVPMRPVHDPIASVPMRPVQCLCPPRDDRVQRDRGLSPCDGDTGNRAVVHLEVLLSTHCEH